MTDANRRFHFKVGFDVYANNECDAANVLFTMLDHLLLDPLNKDGDVEFRNYWCDSYVRDRNKIGKQEEEE